MKKKEILKKDLISKVAEDTGYTKKQVEEVYDAIGVVVKDSIAEGKNFRLFNILTFSTKILKARSGQIKTKENEVIDWATEEREVPTVKLSRAFRK